jgi:hypothetical protein
METVDSVIDKNILVQPIKPNDWGCRIKKVLISTRRRKISFKLQSMRSKHRYSVTSGCG